MGATSSPDRRRREDSRERREYRDRSRERSRGGDDRRRHDSSSRALHDRRDRPGASTSGREHHQQHQQHQQHGGGSGSTRDRPSKGSSRPDGRRDDDDGDAAGGSSPGPRGAPPRQQQPARDNGRHGGGAEAAEAGGGGQRWGKPEEWAADEAAAAPPAAPKAKEGPNLGLSGKLAAETNKTADGASELKFQPPREARVCKQPVWRLYTFKGKETLGQPLALTQLPYYLFGKDRGVADFPTDHPSCSRQHAVIVFREVQMDAPDGIGYTRATKPYLIDLESINGTFINSERVEPARYYELLTGDVVRFGLSSREYVLMNEAVAAAAQL